MKEYLKDVCEHTPTVVSSQIWVLIGVFKMSITTEHDARATAAEQTESIDMLINPSDIDEKATEWSDIDSMDLEHELAESASIMRSENQSPYQSIAEQLAIELTKDALTRAPMSDLVFDDKQTAVENGYWPYKTDKWTVEELIHESDKDPQTDLGMIYHECLNEAWNTVQAGIMDGLQPQTDS